MRTIFLYKGRTEKHAFCRATLKCRPYRVVHYEDDCFDSFLIEYTRLCQQHFICPRGETEEDENWLVENFANHFMTPGTQEEKDENNRE
jgi:hypothetical protein